MKNLFILFLVTIIWTSRGFYSMPLAMMFINDLPKESRGMAYIIPVIEPKNSLTNYRVVYPVIEKDN